MIQSDIFGEIRRGRPRKIQTHDEGQLLEEYKLQLHYSTKRICERWGISESTFRAYISRAV